MSQPEAYNGGTFKNIKERGKKGVNKQKGEKARKGKGLDENGHNWVVNLLGLRPKTSPRGLAIRVTAVKP